MTRNQRKIGFTLAELLVVIAIIGILSGLLLPVVGKARHHAKIALARSMLGQLETAMADYIADHGVYPPEKAPGGYDKPSETLYFYLVGMDVTSPRDSLRKKLRRDRRSAKVYFEFMRNYLEDFDNDGYYEVVDPWGQPWLYIRGMYPGHPNTSSGLGEPATKRPWHHPSSYDLFSVGPDGMTGPGKTTPRTLKKWNDPLRFELGPKAPNSFYKLAAGLFECGMDPDDIANF